MALVRTVGYRLRLKTSLTMSQLFKCFERDPTTQYDHGGLKRLVYFASKPPRAGFTSGAFVTIKDEKKFYEAVEHGGQLVLQLREHDGMPVAISHFVYCHSGNTVLYCSHYQSAQSSTFARFIEKHYRGAVKTARDAALETSGNRTDRRKVKKDYPLVHAIEATPVVRPQAIRALLGGLGRIKTFTYEVATIRDASSIFDPPGTADLRSSRHKFRFGTNAIVGALASKIESVMSTVGIDNFKCASVTGVIGGINQAIDLLEHPDVFSTYDYNSVVEEMDVSKLGTCIFVRDMLKVFDENPTLLQEAEG